MIPAKHSNRRPYPLDNDAATSTQLHRALAAAYDPATRAKITSRCRLTGRTCLEVGAGEGSIAWWLADQVGEHGRVVATDLKPDRIPAHHRLETIAHDLTSGVPLAAALGDGYDLIHSRMTLSHLPQRHNLVHQFARMLAPGGWLMVEDWGARRHDEVKSAPTDAAAALWSQAVRAISGVFDAAGTDSRWGQRAFPVMIDAGLVDVETTIAGRFWRGGDPEARHMAAVLTQLHPRLRAAGLTEPQLAQLHALLADPRLAVHGNLMYTTIGRRRPR